MCRFYRTTSLEIFILFALAMQPIFSYSIVFEILQEKSREGAQRFETADHRVQIKKHKNESSFIVKKPPADFSLSEKLEPFCKIVIFRNSPFVGELLLLENHRSYHSLNLRWKQYLCQNNTYKLKPWLQRMLSNYLMTPDQKYLEMMALNNIEITPSHVFTFYQNSSFSENLSILGTGTDKFTRKIVFWRFDLIYTRDELEKQFNVMPNQHNNTTITSVANLSLIQNAQSLFSIQHFESSHLRLTNHSVQNGLHKKNKSSIAQEGSSQKPIWIDENKPSSEYEPLNLKDQLLKSHPDLKIFFGDLSEWVEHCKASHIQITPQSIVQYTLQYCQTKKVPISEETVMLIKEFLSQACSQD